MHLLDANAWCDECDWKTEGKNAMGNAARHYKKTSHFIQMEFYYGHSFGTPRNKEPDPTLQPKLMEETE